MSSEEYIIASASVLADTMTSPFTMMEIELATPSVGLGIERKELLAGDGHGVLSFPKSGRM